MKTFYNRLLAVVITAICAIGACAQTTHIIQAGETLESIAAQYNLTTDEIVSLNPDAANMFFAGMKLQLPGATNSIAASASGYGLLPTRQTMRDHYRRSSICLILIVHTDKPYADDMARVFQNFPMPQRYNEHNIDVRVVKVSGKQKKNDIERILYNNCVGREVVARWFNRDYRGRMNMDLVHDRGCYGAFHDDYLRTVNTARGTATLRDEGIELLESTFVLVCDMEYAEQNKGFKVGAVLAGIGSVAMAVGSAYSEMEAQKAINVGDYAAAYQHRANANSMAAGSAAAAAGAAALADLSKFRVRIHSYLYKLRWDQNLTADLFSNYWIDDSTPAAESERRRRSFNNAMYGLEYIGDFAEASSKTKLKSITDIDAVVLDVCGRSVERSVTALAKKFAIFRPRTPFYCENGSIYSHIGTKEDVMYGKKYEIVKRSKSKNGKIEYKRVGVVQAGSPWNNTGISFDRYFNPEIKGTRFELTKGKYNELAEMPGLQIREMK